MISQAPSVKVENDGLTTHTTVQGSLNPEDKALVDKLLALREKSTSQPAPSADSQTPIIGNSFMGIGKIFRRFVSTQVCGSGAKELAYVETDNFTSTREYFSYYIEFDNSFTG